MEAMKIQEHARKLRDAHGEKAAAEAAQKARIYEQNGDEAQAKARVNPTDWIRRVRSYFGPDCHLTAPAMQKNTRAILLLANLLCAVASGAAQATSTAVPDAGAPAAPAPGTIAPAPKLDNATATDDLTTGTLSAPKTREQKLQDCMAIWEPATHMTKAQWKRTCNRQLDEEPRP
jgi:hypothetical protein